MKKIWGFIKTFFKACFLFAALLGGALICGIAFLIYSFFSFEAERPSLPKEFVLTMDLDKIMPEKISADLFSMLADDVPNYNFKDAVFALKEASSDPRVNSLAAKVNSSYLGLAQAEEIREQVLTFSKNNKPTLIYSETIGLDGAGTLEYYLASAFSEIWVQPTGTVNFVGIAMETPFFKPVLQKLGISFEVYARNEYKAGAESLTLDAMSLPVKENMTAVAENIYGQVINSVAKSRKSTVEELKALVDISPLSAGKALKHKLVDGLAYKGDFSKKFKDLPKVDIEDYINILKSEKKNKAKDKIALLYVDGMIVSGMGGDSSVFANSQFADADVITAMIEEIAEDKDVKALVVRINSPGGSYVASDAIWYALEEVKKQNKLPIVASLGDTAASGGYFVAMAADKIVADALTLTGSVGVFGGKPVLTEMWQKIGVNWSSITQGENADMMTVNQPFTEKQKKAFQSSLDDVYADFTAKMAKARNFNAKQVDEVAGGRVWLGEQALSVGLVDNIGGLDLAIKIAGDMAGLKDKDFVLISYPEEKSKFELLADFLDSKMIVEPLDILSFVMRKLTLWGVSDTLLLSPFYETRLK